MRVVTILGRHEGDGTDAIEEHGQHLAQAMSDIGVHARCVDLSRERGRDDIAGSDAVIVQYNPFLYGRRGVAPWLPSLLWSVRRGRAAPVIALLIHEPAYPWGGVRGSVMAFAQRCQLFACRLPSDLVLCSIEPWTRRFSRWRPRRPTVHLPVSSNLPDCRAARDETRAALGVGSEDTAVATLTSGHPSHLTDLVVAAITRIDRAGQHVVHLNLGAHSRPSLGLPPRVRSVRPGFLTAADLGAHLAAADVFLAPLVDGVSTRRTSVMSALQQGVAIVGTDGELTDPSLRRVPDALMLTPASNATAFAAAAERLASSAPLRAQTGARGRQLFEEAFAWPVVARTALELLFPQTVPAPDTVGAVDPRAL